MTLTATHRVGNFSFMTAGVNTPTLDIELFRSLRQATELSVEDQRVADRIERALLATGEPGFALGPQESEYFAKNGRRTWCDYLIYRFKVRVMPRLGESPSFPAYVLIEPTSACNLRCVVCFQVDHSFTRKPFMGVMDVALYKAIVDECVEGGTRAVTLASRGEPTLHPQLGQLLTYSSNRFFDLKLNTNATRLSEALCHEILQSDLNELVFSVDTHDRAVYEKIRVNGKFDEVLANITRFEHLRRRYPRSRLTTRVAGVRFLPEQDVNAFVAFWQARCDHVGYVDVEERWNTYGNAPHPQLTQPCGYLWERMYIWWDGTANPCDVDYKSQLSPGKLSEGSSISALWNSRAYTELRARHSAARRAEIAPCDRCGVT